MATASPLLRRRLRRSSLGSLGGPPRRIYISSCSVPEFLRGVIQYPRCCLDGTAEATAEAEATAALVSSDLDNMLRLHYDEIGEVEG